jgi:hypothetical protein
MREANGIRAMMVLSGAGMNLGRDIEISSPEEANAIRKG